MTADLGQRILDLERRAKNGDPAALSDTTQLVAEHPSDPRVWNLRSFLFARTGNLLNAISDLSKAMELSKPEPSHYFDLGRYNLGLGNTSGALAALSRGLELCDQYGDDYYRESLHFVRADALIRSGKRREAVADLEHVRDGFALWTTELRTKEALMSECR